MGIYRGSVSINVDINDVLDYIDEEDIISYCKEHDINLNNNNSNYDITSEYEITIDDIDFDAISEDDIYLFIKYAMNGKTRGKDYPRTKKEMKEYCNDLIDFYNHTKD